MNVQLSAGKLRLRVSQSEAEVLAAARPLREVLALAPGAQVELHVEPHDGDALEWQVEGVVWRCRVPLVALRTSPRVALRLADGAVLTVVFEVDAWSDQRRATKSTAGP